MNESDINMIKYFWQKCECVEKWVEWENRKEDIRKDDALLVHLLEEFDFLRSALDKYIDRLA